MITVIDDEKLEPEYLAMVAMDVVGIYGDNYSRAKHWNDKDDIHHKFWKKFIEHLEFNGYEIVDKK